MDPFPTGDQSFQPNGNGQSDNGLTQKDVAQNGFPKTGSLDGSSGSPMVPSGGAEQDTPELIPVLEDQGERFDKARNSAIKVYVVLILVGIIIGAITLFGVVMVMQHFGLTDVPTPAEQR